MTGARGTTSTFVGGDITLTVEIDNTGRADNPGLQFQIGELDDYADLVGCVPKCSTRTGFGDVYTVLPGVKAGADRTYEVGFVANKVGAVSWSICVYDDVEFGEQIFCGELTTTIR